MDALLYSVLGGESYHLHLNQDEISCDMLGGFWLVTHLLGLTNPVAPVLSLLVIVRVEVQVVQYHLKVTLSPSTKIEVPV